MMGTMDIEDFTLKLVRDYRDKEEACETLLCSLRAENRKLRRDGRGVEDRMDVVSQIRVLEAQKIAYIQARIDIASIQDHLGIG